VTRIGSRTTKRLARGVSAIWAIASVGISDSGDEEMTKFVSQVHIGTGNISIPETM